MKTPLKIYIASSFKHLHGVRLLGRELNRLGCQILDWTEKATPPPGLTPAERRIWMDTDVAGGEVFEFCKNACMTADLVIYYGASGQDAGVEVGIAVASGVPVLGIRGPLEGPGLMLHGAVTVWVEQAEDAIDIIEEVLKHRDSDFTTLGTSTNLATVMLGSQIADRSHLDHLPAETSQI